MKKTLDYLILLKIQRNQSVDTLLKIGFDYYEIANEISYLLDGKFITPRKNKYIITEKGKLYLEKGSRSLIEPLEGFKCDKINVEDIYLP